METVGNGEKRKAPDTSLFCDGSVYASNWKIGVYSFPSGTIGSMGSMGTPFTRAQWLELQRQAMIYKYINASIPVPPYLLIPLHYSNASFYSGAGSLVNLGFLANNTDPEPRRCRRTDGKKWRCSKDAAPDKKYCEHHMHRGKPRSRKPVEAPKSKATESTTAIVTPTNAISVASPVVRDVEKLSWNCVGFLDSYGLFGNQEDKSSSQLKHAESKTRVIEETPDDDTCKQQHQTLPNLHYSNINDYSFSVPNSDCSSINEKPVSMQDKSIKTRGFIDAWSTEKAATLTSVNSLASPDLPHSGLSLSMPNDQIDVAISDSLSSRQSTVTWGNHDSSLCGPLGEFFQPHQQQYIDYTEEPHTPEMLIYLWSKEYNDSNEICPHEVSPTRPVVSSPTGVLQKTLISQSDNSNVSSPSFIGMGPAIYHQHVFSDFK